MGKDAHAYTWKLLAVCLTGIQVARNVYSLVQAIKHQYLVFNNCSFTVLLHIRMEYFKICLLTSFRVNLLPFMQISLEGWSFK